MDFKMKKYLRVTSYGSIKPPKKPSKVDDAYIKGVKYGRFICALDILWGQTTAKEELAKQMEDMGLPSLAKAYRKVCKDD
jgi:hypothetical protein